MSKKRFMPVQDVAGFVIVDLDTGTILGTNVTLVQSSIAGRMEGMSDSEIISFADKVGWSIYADKRVVQ